MYKIFFYLPWTVGVIFLAPDPDKCWGTSSCWMGSKLWQPFLQSLSGVKPANGCVGFTAIGPVSQAMPVYHGVPKKRWDMSLSAMTPACQLRVMTAKLDSTFTPPTHDVDDTKVPHPHGTHLKFCDQSKCSSQCEKAVERCSKQPIFLSVEYVKAKTTEVFWKMICRTAIMYPKMGNICPLDKKKR